MTSNEIKNELYEIKKWEEKITRIDLIYETKIMYMIFSNVKQ